MAAAPSSTDMGKAITDFLLSKNVPPKTTWLAQMLPSIRPSTPVLASQQTALFRLLSTDLTTSVQPSASMVFPADVSNPQVEKRALRGPVTVQVLDIENIGQSRWSQVEDLEAEERGETTKGREIIRVVSDDSNETTTGSGAGFAAMPKSGPHKFLVQDAAGTQCYAFDLSPIPSMNMSQLPMGAKLVLRDLNLARGVALLEPKNVEVLGGRVEAWDKKWRAERKTTLKRKAEIGSAEE